MSEPTTTGDQAYIDRLCREVFALSDGVAQAAETGAHFEIASGKSAKDLGIPMPNPTIKPFICAFGMTVMFSGLLFIHKDKMPLALTTIIGGALLMTTALYAWVLTPLEDAH